MQIVFGSNGEDDDVGEGAGGGSGGTSVVDVGSGLTVGGMRVLVDCDSEDSSVGNGRVVGGIRVLVETAWGEVWSVEARGDGGADELVWVT